MLILCPYCCVPLDDDTEHRRLDAWRAGRSGVPCATCGGDVTCDAPIESTPEKYVAQANASACVFCAAPRHSFAVRCAGCKRWQNPRTDALRAENAAIDAATGRED